MCEPDPWAAPGLTPAARWDRSSSWRCSCSASWPEDEQWRDTCQHRWQQVSKQRRSPDKHHCEGVLPSKNSYCFAGNCTFAFFSHYRTTFNIWSYWESLHEGTELTHELWKIPSLHQRCSELEWNTKHREDHIRQSQVGDVEVRHRLHSPGG